MALALESNEGHHTAFQVLETHHQTLHWLPVTHQIQYKISTLCFSSISGTSPQYIYMSSLLQSYTARRRLWSASDTWTFFTPRLNIFIFLFLVKDHFLTLVRLSGTVCLKYSTTLSLPPLSKPVQQHFLNCLFHSHVYTPHPTRKCMHAWQCVLLVLL